MHFLLESCVSVFPSWAYLCRSSCCSNSLFLIAAHTHVSVFVFVSVWHCCSCLCVCECSLICSYACCCYSCSYIADEQHCSSSRCHDVYFNSETPPHTGNSNSQTPGDSVSTLGRCCSCGYSSTWLHNPQAKGVMRVDQHTRSLLLLRHSHGIGSMPFALLYTGWQSQLPQLQFILLQRHHPTWCQSCYCGL